MLATDRPRFKQELVAEPIEDGGARFIDLMDPDSGNVFRFYEVEYALACAMDGERDVAGIVRWAQEELGLSPSPTEVQTVIATLGDLGYLEVRPPAETVAPVTVVETAPTRPAKPEPKLDDELARGVIVGPQAVAPPIATENYELGASGGHVAVARGDLPPAPELALGHAGTSTAPKKAEPIAVDDIKLGASGAAAEPPAPQPAKADVSMDLSADFALRPDDVKEAVRASKVMSAVDVSQDVLDAVEAKPEPKKAEAKPEAKKPEPKKPEPEPKKADAKVEAKKPEPKKKADPTEKLPDSKAVAAAAEAKKPEAKKADAKPEAKKPEAKKADAKAEPKKADTKKAADAKKPVTEEKKPVVSPPAPKSGVSPALIVLLLLAVVGGGVFLVWKYVLDKPAAEPTPAPVAPVKKEPPPPPPAPSAKLGLDTPAPVDVKPTVAGTVEWLEANDKLVKTGDPVAKLAGNAPVQAAVDALKKDADKAPAAIEAAQKELDAAKDDAAKAAAQAKVDAAKKVQDTKQQALVAKQAELDKFLVKATADGKLTVIAKKDAKVTEADVVAKIAQEPMLAATFTAPGGKYVAGSPATLKLKGGDKKLSCTVADVQGDQVKVVCTADASIPAGADVELE